MPSYKNYDPALVVCTFKGIRLTGYADGTFISAEREEDAFSKSVGAGGDVTRVRNRNRSGSVTVTLQASSPTNDLLSAIANEDEILGTGVGTLLVKNINGTTILEAENAWIRKMPTVEAAKDASSREWAFDCAELVMVIGGALV